MSSDDPSIPQPYKVSYSQLVCNELRDLIARTRATGQTEAYLEAAKEIAARLRIYPQFGEPIIDLNHPIGTIWIGSIGPLVVRYAIYEDLRLIIVAVPIQAMPKLGSDSITGSD